MSRQLVTAAAANSSSVRWHRGYGSSRTKLGVCVALSRWQGWCRLDQNPGPSGFKSCCRSEKRLLRLRGPGFHDSSSKCPSERSRLSFRDQRGGVAFGFGRRGILASRSGPFGWRLA